MFEDNRLFSNINPEEYFLVQNGDILKNVKELASSLESMDEVTFNHHVNEERNDFASWISNVFNDKNLASQISNLKNREEIIQALNAKLSKSASAKKKVPLFFKKNKHNDHHPKHEIKESKEVPVVENSPLDSIPDIKTTTENSEISKKLDDVLTKEIEIEKREQKILEIEQHIEERLEKLKTSNIKEDKFFSKEFMQGLTTGLLATLIFGLIYIKFFF